MHEPSQWQTIVKNNPAHSVWYAQRFRDMEAQGRDLLGEARLIDAMATRGSWILDAGCGPGRLDQYLAQQGHHVVGVDIDPYLIGVARAEKPGPTYLVGDLVDLDLPAQGIDQRFDIIVSAGNVLTFLAPSTRQAAIARLAAHLAPRGRIVVGFGLQRGYSVDQFRADAEDSGLRIEAEYESWGIDPLTPESQFLVAVLRAR